MRSEYVNLDRRFEVVTPGADPEEEALRSYFTFENGREGWSDVLASRVLVVLGEAGSGKSWELEAQAERICGEGRPAFFIRLENLQEQPLVEAIEPSQSVVFQRWLRQDNEAVFFLDAVDEARLTSRYAFHTAIQNLARGAGPALGRLRAVVSCRVSEWHWHSDVEVLQRELRIKPQLGRGDGQDETAELRVATIVPLDPVRVCRLAMKLGVTDVEAFAAGIEHADAWSYVARPGDVADFAEYWIKEKRFGSLSEILRFSVERRLHEPNRSDTIALEKLRQGARALAAAAVFCRTLAFRTSGADLAARSSSIDPYAVLDDWSAANVESLLTRALFDGEHFGKIRFHHRSIVDFLAAEWVRGLQNIPVGRVLPLLFASHREGTVLLPSRAGLAAWLAGGDSALAVRIRAELLHAKPQVLIDKGDPQQLPVLVRADMLRSLRDRYVGRTRARLGPPDATQLRRIAHPELAAVINDLVRDPTTPVDIKELLLSVAAQGKLAGCVPLGLEILVTPPADYDGLHFNGLRVVQEAGSDADLRAAYQSLRGYPGLGESLCELAIKSLYPRATTAADVIELLERVPTPSERDSNRLGRELKRQFEAGDFDNDLVSFLAALVGLLRREPHHEGHFAKYRVSQRFSWLGGALLAAVARLLGKKKVDVALAEAIGEAMLILNGCKRVGGHRFQDISVNESSAKHPQVREAYILALYRFLLAMDEGGVVNESAFGAARLIDPEMVDFQWLTPAIRNERDTRRRRWLLNAALAAWRWLGRPKEVLPTLRSAVPDDPQLLAQIPRPGLLYAIVDRRRRLENWWINFGWRIPQAWRNFNDWRYKRQFWLRMWLRCNDLRSARADGWLYDILHDDAVQNSSSSYADASKARMLKAYGDRIGGAAWEGTKIYWRQQAPEPRLESRADNQVRPNLKIGLYGIAASVADGLDFSSVDARTARAAAAFATHELNSFPDWIVALRAAYPTEVDDVLLACIRDEWQLPPEQQSVHGVLSKLQYDCSGVAAPYGELVLNELARSDPRHPLALNQALAIVMRDAALCLRLADLAAQRLEVHRPPNKHFYAWLMVCLMIDAAGALNKLEPLLQQSDPQEADALVTTLAAALHEPSRVGLQKADPSYLRLPAVVRLARLLCRHVRTTNDIHRKGVFTPGARDDAQQVRGRLLSALGDIPGTVADDALAALQRDAEFEPFHDWLAKLIEERTEAAAEPPAWEPSEVPQFARTFEKPPASNAELNTLVLWRIEDLQDLVQDADFPMRNVIDAQRSNEYDLQRFVARELERECHGLFSVERESEVVDDKRTDVRIKSNALGPITIEIKWADRWSFDELVRKLEAQLVHQYLRARRSRHGIYLVAYRGRLPSNCSLDWSGLVAHLRASAKDVLARSPEVDTLEVVPISFEGKKR